MSYNFSRFASIFLCLLGMVISLYAYYVDVRKETDPTYRAACDISEYISCSRVFTSKYGKGFGLVEHIVGKTHWLNQPNTVFGLAFYTLQIFLNFQHTLQQATLQIALSLVSNMASIYLGFILFYVLNDVCVVCVTIYALNFLILLCDISRRRHLQAIFDKRTKKSS